MNIRRSTLLGTAIAFALYQQSAMADAATAPSTDQAASGEEMAEVIKREYLHASFLRQVTRFDPTTGV